MRHRVTWVLVLSSALLIAQRAFGQSSRVVIRRADIQAAGWQRISEVLDAAPGWRVASTDGFTMSASPDGLPAVGASGSGAPLPTVIVDGVAVPVSVLGQQELEFVPVILAQVDSVVLTGAPRLVASRVEWRGTIEFFSRRVPPGVAAQGEFQVGDVARKPGLYRYTPIAPFNREHHGPFHHLLFDFGGSRGGVALGYRFATLNTTDSLLASRTPLGLNAGTAQINLAAPVAHGDLDLFGGHHAFNATRTHYSGLYFVPALGHEQALRMYATTIGASGRLAALGDGISYSVGYTADDATPLPSPSPSSLVHRRRNLSGTVELRGTFGQWRGVIGGAVERWTLTSPLLGGERSAQGERVSGSLTAPRLDRWENTISASASLDGGIRPSALLVSRIAPSARDAFTLVVSATDESPRADGHWIDPTLLGQRLPDPDVRSVAGTVEWTRTLGDHLTGMAGARVTHASGWTVGQAADTGFFELRGKGPRDPLAADGSVAALQAGLETSGDNRFGGRLLYSFSRGLGDSAFVAASHSVARHQLNGMAWLIPARDWRVTGLVQAVSATEWPAFPPIGGGWRPEVAGFTRVDAGVEKWMWSRRLRFQYIVRDVLNESERWQPRSVQFNLRWMLSASFALGIPN